MLLQIRAQKRPGHSRDAVARLTTFFSRTTDGYIGLMITDWNDSCILNLSALKSHNLCGRAQGRALPGQSPLPRVRRRMVRLQIPQTDRNCTEAKFLPSIKIYSDGKEVHCSHASVILTGRGLLNVNLSHSARHTKDVVCHYTTEEAFRDTLEWFQRTSGRSVGLFYFRVLLKLFGKERKSLSMKQFEFLSTEVGQWAILVTAPYSLHSGYQFSL